MKVTLKLLIPRAGDIAADLSVDHDPGVGMARERLQTLRREADRAQERSREAATALASLRRAVRDGAERPSALEDAIAADRAAALVIPEYGPRIAAAEAAIEVAVKDAKVSIVSEAGRRGAQLQGIADELRPVLSALRDAEAALDQAVLATGAREGVTPLDWPSSLEDEGRAANQLFLGMNTPT